MYFMASLEGFEGGEPIIDRGAIITGGPPESGARARRFASRSCLRSLRAHLHFWDSLRRCASVQTRRSGSQRRFSARPTIGHAFRANDRGERALPCRGPALPREL